MTLQPRSRMLKSVFPATIISTTSPTPQATPLLSQSSFSGAGTHAANKSDGAGSDDSAAEKVRWERAWHIATSFLLDQLRSNARIKSRKDCPRDVMEAILYLRSPDSVGFRLRRADRANDLAWWYSQTIQSFALRDRMPALKVLCEGPIASPSSWLDICHKLVRCRSSLLSTYQELVAPVAERASRYGWNAVAETYDSLVIEAVAASLEPKVLNLITSCSSMILAPDDNVLAQDEDSMEGVETSVRDDAITLLLAVLSELLQGGLSKAWLERLLAKGLNQVIKSFIWLTFGRRWDSPSPCVDELRDWIAGPFRALAEQALGSLSSKLSQNQPSSSQIATKHVREWQQYAVDELGKLRLSELFDIVVEWDNGSKGGIEDLRHYVHTAQRRMYVIATFLGVLSYRLLIPGASTTEILQMYIRIIRALALLDSRFVILERVGRPIRRYLRDREDTVRIIIGGLLADLADPNPPTDALVELATELHQMEEITTSEDAEELDWDDMQWMPNPADAEPDFRKSKSLDVIGNLVSLFDNKEIFVREFQHILGERLLGASVDFDSEIRVLELLKSRFGDAALQGCEVMLKDIFDSRRTDILIKKELQPEEKTPVPPEMFTKILSRFFWPSLRGDEFRIPAPVQSIQERYARGFEEHKMQRKLAWLPALGQATVELQLKYRTVSELVTTWQASVIHAFGSEDGESSPQKTAEQLETELEMDEDLVANALTFWVSKLVLFQPQPGTYEVLEVLPTEEDVDSAAGEQKASADIVAAAQSASAAAAASAASAVRSEEELAEEKMEVVWQYVVGMLTNQGSMPLQQMVMMLNFVVPGGFTHTKEEFRSFLQRRVDDGRLEMAGANYKIPKK